MKVQIALVQTEGTPFALAVVSEALLDDPNRRDETLRFYEERVFRDLPVVLVSDNFLLLPRFYGTKEFAEFMEGVQMDMIEWTTLDLPLPSS